jgi:hypothetical protein
MPSALASVVFLLAATLYYERHDMSCFVKCHSKSNNQYKQNEIMQLIDSLIQKNIWLTATKYPFLGILPFCIDDFLTLSPTRHLPNLTMGNMGVL